MIGIREFARTCRPNSSPSIFGMRRSVINRSGDQLFISCKASTPSPAVRVPYPKLDRVVFSTRVICGSSSTTRMFPFAPEVITSLHFLGDDVNVHRRRIPQEFVDRGKIQVPSP